MPLPAGATIAHLIETDGPGGAERVVVHLVSRLAARGFHNVVLLPERGEGWLAAQLPRERVEIIPTPLMGVSLWHSFRRIHEIIRQHRPVVAHSHEFTMAALGAAACWRRGVPHVFTLHGGRYYASRWHRRLATSLAARAAAAVIAVSETVAKQLREDLTPPPPRLRLIPNGIPEIPVVAPTLRSELGLPPDARLVVTVGNLYGVKGHADLLSAIAAIRQAVPAIHVAIAGRGPEEDALRRHAASLGLTDRLHLLGLRSDIPNILRSGDVFVLSSHSEGLPLALLEAMRAARPIVATNVGEVPIVLNQGEAGLIVRPRDVNGLGAAMQRLLTNGAEAAKLGARAGAIAAERYDIDRMIDRYVNLYGEAIDLAAK